MAPRLHTALRKDHGDVPNVEIVQTLRSSHGGIASYRDERGDDFGRCDQPDSGGLDHGGLVLYDVDTALYIKVADSFGLSTASQDREGERGKERVNMTILLVTLLSLNTRRI